MQHFRITSKFNLRKQFDPNGTQRICHTLFTTCLFRCVLYKATQLLVCTLTSPLTVALVASSWLAGGQCAKMSMDIKTCLFPSKFRRKTTRNTFHHDAIKPKKSPGTMIWDASDANPMHRRLPAEAPNQNGCWKSKMVSKKIERWYTCVFTKKNGMVKTRLEKKLASFSWQVVSRRRNEQKSKTESKDKSDEVTAFRCQKRLSVKVLRVEKLWKLPSTSYFLFFCWF